MSWDFCGTSVYPFDSNHTLNSGTVIYTSHNSKGVYLPTFSSDGKYILFSTSYNTYPDFDLLEVESKTVKRVTYTNASCRVYYAAFSPDNKKIIFSTDCNSVITCR